jgi:hypothetical protein
MTYWYETPDDQKDTWHWMGVAISLAHTIGLHRNPESSSMEESKKRLWKRIWWSCFMRDRLVALGMRRPTRIKDEDYDVPMLTLDDFEIAPLASDNLLFTPPLQLLKDTGRQEQLAVMCIEKAKLCLVISHVLTAQYSVLIKDQGMQTSSGSSRSSLMLFPKKLDQRGEVKSCGSELEKWREELPPCCLYRTPAPIDIATGDSTMAVQRALLHMVYYTTLSALHRPQVLPNPATKSSSDGQSQHDVSRQRVSEASREITRISSDLQRYQLERYLPTTGVTVLLPAIIIHLLDIKSTDQKVSDEARTGFCHCMQVLQKLKDNYASADYAIQFLEAAIRKADIDLAWNDETLKTNASHPEAMRQGVAKITRTPLESNRTNWTPPPEHGAMPDETYVEQFPSTAETPPGSEGSNNNDVPQVQDPAFELDFSEYDAGMGAGAFENIEWPLPEEGMHGESGGLFADMPNFTWPISTTPMVGSPRALLDD